MNRSPKVDAYIAKSAPFARPILTRLRSLFHTGCPRVEETIKWGFPSFEHMGMLGFMAAFKQHASFGFWRQSELPDPHGIFLAKSGMGGSKYADVSQLPADSILLQYIKAAVKRNEAGPSKRPKRAPKPPVKVPPYFQAALRTNRKALATFEAFPPGKRRDYVEWIADAKQEATRRQRIATALGWLAQGKSRNWKYE